MLLCWKSQIFVTKKAGQFSVGDSHGMFVVEEELEVGL
jgi:hypothetical protein